MTPHPDGVRFFRGVLIALALVAPFWLPIAAGIAFLIWSLT